MHLLFEPAIGKKELLFLLSLKNMIIFAAKTKKYPVKKLLLLMGMLSLSFVGFAQRQTDYALSLLPKEKDEKPIYYDLPSISNLEISVGHNDTVSLSWNLPNNVDEAVLTMSNMQVWDYIGTAAGQCASDISQLFLSSLLRPFVGWGIKDVSVIFCPDDTLGGYQPDYPNYYIRVWKGGDNPLLVCDQYVNHPIYGSVQTIPLDTNVIIDEDVNLRIGYFTDRYRSYTWACDFRSMPQEGNGCLSLQLYHNDNNELHECFPDNRWYDQYVLPNNLCVAATLINPNENGTQGRTLTGYRVYRDDEIIKEIPYTVVTHFTDTEFMKGFDVEYCVTAVYGEEESEPVCATATITGVNEADNDGIVVSPNPTIGLVRIEGACVAEVKVHNILGQMVKTIQSANTFSVSGLPAGLYLLRITDGEGATVTRRIVVK